MDALLPRIPQKSRKERDHANAGAVTILVENTQIAEKSGRHPCWQLPLFGAGHHK
jgi:hypothetical protein